MQKRGLAIQFNFIFVIVAGAIILSFFTGFAFRYKDLQEDRNEIEVLKTFDNALYALQSSSLLTTKEANLPTRVEFDCDNIIVNDKKLKTSKYIFAPTSLGKNTLIWYNPWKFPFRIADFYYIIPKTQKFYLVYDSESKNFVDSLIEKVPEKLQNNLYALPLNQVPGKKGKLIFFTNTVNNLQIIPSMYEEYGFVKYNDKQTEYIGFPLLFGAIFSKDINEYNCLKNKAIKDLNSIYKVYQNKASVLKSQPLLAFCNYDAIIPEFNIQTTNAQELYQKAQNLGEINKQIIGQGQGCEAVF